MMNELQTLAAFVSETTFNDIPRDVVDRAKWVLRDTIGVILGGMTAPEVAAMAHFATEHESGKVTIFGHGGRVKPRWAALIHGTAGTTLEMDEGHAFARGHAAIHAVPPALALADAQGLDGKETLTAFILGYEVAARAGVATRLRLGVHPFGAWGVLGAAAIGARCMKLNAQDTAGVLEVAASYAITPSFESAYQGANVRNTYAGMVNKAGLLAAELYTLGIRGEKGALQTTFGHILGDSFDPNALVQHLGERYEIMRGYFKPYSACRYAHAAVDATFMILDKGPVDLAALESIAVETYDIAASLREPEPQTPLAGRFSVPYTVAATLTLGSAGPEAFTSDALRNPQILTLAAQTQLSEDPEFTAMTPGKRPARVTLTFSDGSQRSAMVTGSKGDPDQPMSPDELETKYHSLSDPVIGAQAATTAWQKIGKLETLGDLSAVTALLGDSKVS
jgi:2-methylcitrate dehydratase PrpD